MEMWSVLYRMKQSQVYQLQRCLYLRQVKGGSGGFTLLEALIVVVLIALLMAIAAPSWLGWLENRHVIAAQDDVYTAMRLAQQKASQNRAIWQFSIRDTGGQLEWAIHQSSVSPTLYPAWKSLNHAVQFDPKDTTLQKDSRDKSVHYVRFNHTGDISGQLGTVTFMGRSGGKSRRCVVASTLIGALRKGEEHSKPKGKRYCY
ncbi:prepilin-type cleavage/methylation domain-containing protein [filamentous cyanobacterium CCP5]|nr:prepilin-type cleavage/methylation domain-containing protein [filamentous cyanobacterium CCP5]